MTRLAFRGGASLAALKRLGRREGKGDRIVWNCWLAPSASLAFDITIWHPCNSSTTYSKRSGERARAHERIVPPQEQWGRVSSKGRQSHVVGCFSNGLPSGSRTAYETSRSRVSPAPASPPPTLTCRRECGTRPRVAKSLCGAASFPGTARQ